jgi:alkylation response protein AidB-like acyl-CoA dehydrogenase
MPTELDRWTDEAASWLEAHARRKPSREDLRFGEGTDNVGLFKNLDAEAERAHIDEVRAWQRLKSDAGYGSISWPTAYGGSGLSRAHEQAFSNLEAQFVTPAGHETVGITLDLIAATILTVGTEAQKDRYLRPMRRTDEVWCQMFSEPGAGSDLASLALRAERDGDEWILNGQKVWTSGAQYADFGYILCRSDPEAPRHKGLTAFVLSMKTPGVDIRPLRQMSGGSSFNEVFFTDVRVPADGLLGAVGEGWSVAITTLGFERAAATKSGTSGSDLFERLVLLARHLERHGDPLIRQQLADVYISGRIGAITRRRVAATLKEGGVPGPEGSVGKLFWTDGLRQISETASALLGPSLIADTGVWGTYAWSEFVNGVPGFRIAGGSDEIQRNIVAERSLGLPREPR